MSCMWNSWQRIVRVPSTVAEGCLDDRQISRPSIRPSLSTCRGTLRKWRRVWRRWCAASTEPSRMWGLDRSWRSERVLQSVALNDPPLSAPLTRWRLWAWATFRHTETQWTAWENLWTWVLRWSATILTRLTRYISNKHCFHERQMSRVA